MQYARENEIFSKLEGKCFYCGTELIPFTRIQPISQHMPSTIYANSFVVDHLVPRRLGGTDEFSNLVPSCWSCNTEKGGKNIEDWRWYRTFKIAGIPDFSEEQIEWLLSVDINILEKLPQFHQFYFEEKGFTI